MGTTITLIADIVTIVITGDRPYEGPTYEKFEGWYGTPSGVDMGFVKRPGAPGAFAPEQTFPDEAIVSIEGKHFAKSRALGLQMREDLTALYNEGRPIRAVVQDDLRTTEREVLVESVSFPWTIHADFDFSIDMRAGDPRRYGVERSVSTTLAAPGTGLLLPFDEATGRGLALPSNEAPNPDLGIDFGTIGVDGRVLVTNDGNTETVSLYRVDGGSMPDGFVVVNVKTGERLTYLGPVASGTNVTLDTSTRTAFINGASPAGRWLQSPQWWAVPPRSSLEVAFLALGPTTGTPRLTVTTADGFY